MIIQGLIITVVGMAVTFLFLILLVVATHRTGKLISRLEALKSSTPPPTKKEKVALPSATQPAPAAAAAAPAPAALPQEQLAAVIAVAQREFGLPLK